jgi:FMN phosphatase YigB (HAD superfamily)
MNRIVKSIYFDIRGTLVNDNLFDDLEPDHRITGILQSLKEMNYTIYALGDCRYIEMNNILVHKGFMTYIDYFVSAYSEIPTLNPEIYRSLLDRNRIYPSQCLAVEYSSIGRESASSVGCHTMMVKDPNDLSLKSILETVTRIDRCSIV